WILDDIGALQAWNAQITSERAHLFAPRDAYRWNSTLGTWATGDGAGENPAGDADLTFYLGVLPPKKNPAKIEILDGSAVVRTITVDRPVIGVNRVWWDLNYDTVPLVANYHAQQTGFTAPQVLPGTYTARLVANGTQQNVPLRVLPDPRTPATVAQMREAFLLTMQLRTDFTRTGKEIEALRALQGKLENAAKVARAPDTRQAVAQMQQATIAALAGLYISNAQSWEDTLREASKLYERIASLAGSLAGSDYAPTNGQRDLAASIQADFAQAIATDDAIFGAHLQSLNTLLRRDRLAPIATTR
ncbi:MAG: hypothetical protein JOY69_04550, partial [Candidatus Eremiobacteraeota bacterium]|nr:hypothetical protein [Candidatus Eremiobacteraeota bacterium]